MRKFRTTDDLHKSDIESGHNLSAEISQMKTVLSRYTVEVEKQMLATSKRLDSIEYIVQNSNLNNTANVGNPFLNNTPISYTNPVDDIEGNENNLFLSPNLVRYSKQLSLIIESYNGKLDVFLLSYVKEKFVLISRYFPNLSSPEIIYLLIPFLPKEIKKLAYNIAAHNPTEQDFINFISSLCSNTVDSFLNSDLLNLKSFFNTNFNELNFLNIISHIENLSSSLNVSQLDRYKLIVNKLSHYMPLSIATLINNTPINTSADYRKIINIIISPSNLGQINAFISRNKIHSVSSPDSSSVPKKGSTSTKYCCRCGLKSHNAKDCKIYGYSKQFCQACLNLKNVKLYHNDVMCRSRAKAPPKQNPKSKN